MDILNKLGKKKEASAEGAAENKTSAAPGQVDNTHSDMSKGTDILSRAGQSAIDPDNAAKSGQKKAEDSLESKSSSGKEEPSGSETVNDPESWTKDSAFKEIKKLREENKAYRLKYAEQLEQLEKETQERLSAREKELEEARKAQAELDRIKEEQEDKKKSIEEKLAAREAKLAEIQTMSEAREKEFQRQVQEMESKLRQFEADREAELQVHKSRLDEELNRIPEKYREHAELLVRGAGDARDALVALHEAKLKGMFEDKTSIVNHSVPGAHDGARATKERLDAAAEEQRKKMTPSQKIKAALDAVKSGESNSAFRGRNN